MLAPMTLHGGRPVHISQDELDSARLDILRRRVTVFGLVLGVLIFVLVAVQLYVMVRVLDLPLNRPQLLKVAGGALTGLALIMAPRIMRRRMQRRTLRSFLWRTIFIVLIAVLGQLTGAQYIARGMSEAIRPLGFTGNIGPIFPLVIFMAVVHTSATLIVPWTLLEACIPPLVLASITLASYLFTQNNDSQGFAAAGIGLSLASGLPGLAVTLLRRDTLGLRVVESRYSDVERELSTARRIHDRLFPAPIDAGPIRMGYRYEPMRQIGGDYLDASRHPDGSLTLALIDVTGHGVAAALAVNRLHGELKRVFAQHPDADPASVITALNEYIHLTLSDEQVFATAVALRVRPDGAVRLCNAGHPPPLLRRADGSLTPLDSTAAMLGMLPPGDFDAESVGFTLAPGEVLVLYTDGATEAMDRGGRQLGIGGISRAVQSLERPDPMTLPQQVLDAVLAFRAGPSQDDTLIVALGP